MSVLIKKKDDLQAIKKAYQDQNKKYRHQILVCAGAGCVSSDCYTVRDAVLEQIKALSLKDSVKVYETGCMGTCAVGPVMLILPERIFYTELSAETAQKIVKAHIVDNKVLEEYTFFDHALNKHIPKIDDINFSKEQIRITLRNCGILAYNNIESYNASGG